MEVRKLIIVVGKICSGKDTFADNVFPEALKIDIGSIVRQITRRVQRVHQPSLDSQIIAEVHRLINTTEKPIIVTGIRQLSIYNNLLLLSSGRRFHQQTYYLDCPLDVLKARFERRNDPKDFIALLSFEEVIDRDAALGLAELEEVVLSNSNTIIINTNIDETNALQEIQKWKDSAVGN